MNVEIEEQSSLDEELGRLMDAGDPAALANPYPVWKQLRERARPHRRGPRVLVSRYHDVKALCQDGSGRYELRLADSAFAKQYEASASPDVAHAFRELYRFHSLWMVSQTGEEHGRMRRIVHRAFTPRRVTELEESMREYVDELLDPLGDGVVDMMQLAYKLPLRVVIDLLECPHEDLEKIAAWAERLGQGLDSTNADAIVGAYHAMLALRDYVADRVEKSRAASDNTSLVAALLDANASERLTEDELVAMFALLLLAGRDTTTSLISHGLHQLLVHREQWQMLCAEPDLWPNAIDELLRFVAPVQYTVRMASEPHDLGGVPIAVGDVLMAILASANRDPDVFEDPDRLDIRRENAKAHLSFSFGPKYCLGNAVAHMEASVIFGELARRFPEMRLATDDVGYGGTLVFRRLAELPVALGPGSG